MRVLAEPGAHHGRHGAGAERAGADRACGRLVAYLGYEGGIGAGIGAAERRTHDDRHVLEPPGEVGEEAERWTVAPVEVVDRHEELPVGRRVRGEPVQPVERGERGVGGRRRRVGIRGAEDRLRRRGSAREPARAYVLVTQDRLEELPDDSEGEVPLELAAAGGEHAGAVLLGGRPELRQQPGLPDAGRSLDESEPALAARRLGQGGPKRFELAIALQQELCPSGVRHGGRS
jgi:hypothetical protein